MSSPIDRLDDRKAALTIKSLNSLLLESSLYIVDNSNIAFSTSKNSQNSMSMSNFSAKENTNVESKNENESGIQDES